MGYWAKHIFSPVRLAKFELAQDDVEYCGHVVGLGKQSPAQLKARTMIDFSILRYKTQWTLKNRTFLHQKKFSLEEGGVVANVPRKWGKGFTRIPFPYVRIDSSEKDMRRTGFEGPEESETR
ncbi:hypothetical protein TNCV_165051 [Trichonephila clavipes]|nr:hypothetical protein TNCV_165051 [Trichonephila clavipes]